MTRLPARFAIVLVAFGASVAPALPTQAADVLPGGYYAPGPQAYPAPPVYAPAPVYPPPTYLPPGPQVYAEPEPLDPGAVAPYGAPPYGAPRYGYQGDFYAVPPAPYGAYRRYGERYEEPRYDHRGYAEPRYGDRSYDDRRYQDRGYDRHQYDQRRYGQRYDEPREAYIPRLRYRESDAYLRPPAPVPCGWTEGPPVWNGYGWVPARVRVCN